MKLAFGAIAIGLALVVQLLALGHGDLDLGLARLVQIEAHGDDGLAVALDGADFELAKGEILIEVEAIAHIGCSQKEA